MAARPQGKYILRYKVDVNSKLDPNPMVTELPTRKYSTSTKLEIISYLTNRDFLRLSSLLFNLPNGFTGEEWEATGSLFDDGIWRWRDDLWLYVLHYDIALPDEFIEHVYTYFRSGGKANPVVIGAYRDMSDPARR